MKKLLLLTLTFSLPHLFAEIWEDYKPSETQIQLTVIDVQSNYLDNYLVNLKRTWVRSVEIQKELGHIRTTVFMFQMVLAAQMFG